MFDFENWRVKLSRIYCFICQRLTRARQGNVKLAVEHHDRSLRWQLYEQEKQYTCDSIRAQRWAATTPPRTHSDQRIVQTSKCADKHSVHALNSKEIASNCPRQTWFLYNFSILLVGVCATVPRFLHLVSLWIDTVLYITNKICTNNFTWTFLAFIFASMFCCFARARNPI